MIGNQYKVVKEYYALDPNYTGEFHLDIGDVVEVYEKRNTSYSVKVVSIDGDGLESTVLLRIPENMMVDKEWFQPFFRDKNLNELLNE